MTFKKFNIVGLEDAEKGLQTEECGYSPETAKDKKTDSPLKPLENVMLPCQPPILA